MNKTIKISFLIAASILLTCGVMHVHGIFFSQDLYPENRELMTLMQSSTIQMSPAGIVWDLWIGFHAMFGMSLVFTGALLLYLAVRQFPFLCRQHYIICLYIITIGFFLWTGNRYLIPPFVISMAVPLVLLITGYLIILTTRPER
ncbi:LIC_13387 family protein [Chitinophaga solisilvae]|uniref:LIC_13387 family protein n=1 Tax=Chitinophaga solisilvae TaxID=1233460 RepID=UPI001370B12D|nr:hypothetical protein [Chitinophaga solisilvae]